MTKRVSCLRLAETVTRKITRRGHTLAVTRDRNTENRCGQKLTLSEHVDLAAARSVVQTSRSMIPRQLLDRRPMPDGRPLELARERGHFVIRIGGVPLMSSALFGSEQRMAELAAARLGGRAAPRVLVGGLGMGFTLRAALDGFGSAAQITVAELLPAIIEYNQGVLGELAGHPLADRRVRLFEGDVRKPLAEGSWDAVLLDIDNGPDALTVADNDHVYRDARGLGRSLTPGGVLVVWSAFPSPAFASRLRRAGLDCEVHRVAARSGPRAGGRHVLFVAVAPPLRG